MIINNLNIICVAVSPSEADTPLVIDPDTVLPFSLAAQALKLVPRRNEQVLKCFGAMQEIQLPPGYPLECLVPPYKTVIEKRLGVFIVEGLYHLQVSYLIETMTSSVIVDDKGNVFIRAVPYPLTKWGVGAVQLRRFPGERQEAKK